MIITADASIHLDLVGKHVLIDNELSSGSGLNRSLSIVSQRNLKSASILTFSLFALFDSVDFHHLVVHVQSFVITSCMDSDLLLELGRYVLDVSCAFRVVNFTDQKCHLSRDVLILLEVGFQNGLTFVDAAATLDDLMSFLLLHPSGENLFLVDNKVLGAQDVCLDL